MNRKLRNLLLWAKKILGLSILLPISITIQAQLSLQDSAIHLAFLDVGTPLQITGGDLTDRFGPMMAPGIEFGWKFQNNLYIKTGLRWVYGEKVREEGILDAISAGEGLLISNDGTLADVRLYGTGWRIPVGMGKIFSFGDLNPNSGFFVGVGSEFIQHKIGFRVIGEKVAALTRERKKGYDRLTNGFGLYESVGFRYFDNKGYVNFSISLEFGQYRTQNRRDINVDTGLQETQKRWDLLHGIRIVWSYPIYERAPDRVYYR